MSEFKIEVVRIGAVERLPNSDSLSITQVHGGYPCIFRTGDFHEGDLAVYVPVDAMVPLARKEFAFLDKSGSTNLRSYELLHPDKRHRIQARRLRGTFSMGLLIPAPPMTKEGDDVQLELGITKYESPADKEEPEVRAVTKAAPSWPWWKRMLSRYAPELLQLFAPRKTTAPKVAYYDIEGYRKHRNFLLPGEQVVITEKLHGQQARFVYVPGKHFWQRGKLHIGSRNFWGRAEDSNWGRIAKQLNLAERLRKLPNFVVFGEIYGASVQKGYDYGRSGLGFRVFDILDLSAGRFLAHYPMVNACTELGLNCVPVLYIGPWSEELTADAEGKTTMPGGTQIREGIVVKPLDGRYDERFGRVILKLHGEGFLTRKGA